LLNSTTLILLMFAGARWGAIGVAVADVAATYSLIAPRLHYSFKGSPITIGMFFSAIFRPATAGVVMAFVLMIFRLALPPMSLVVSLACGGTVALAAFFGTWILMPSGKAELIALILDLKSALRGKSPRVG
jgi:hypothetical protein